MTTKTNILYDSSGSMSQNMTLNYITLKVTAASCVHIITAPL